MKSVERVWHLRCFPDQTSNVVVKEMKFRPKIDEHDYSTKTKHVERFLNEGFKVKVTIMFRGRELAHPELGMKILERIAEQVADEGVVEVTPKIDGRNMTMVIAPTKRKVKTTARSDDGDHAAIVAMIFNGGNGQRAIVMGTKPKEREP